MLIENPLFTMIDSYIKNINFELENKKIFNTEYNCYDEEKDDLVKYYFWNIKSTIQTKNNIITSSINYDGNLEFSYNKKTNQVLVYSLPFLNYGKVNIPIFTNDIALIIKEKIKKFSKSDSINISFLSDFEVFAVDENVKELLPTIINNSNFIRINKILNGIAKEEEQIKKQILNEKAKKDREEKNVKFAVLKKRKIYGIDPEDYSNMKEYSNVMNKKICEVCDKKIQNIMRHLDRNKSEYKKIILEGFNYEYLRLVSYDYDRKFCDKVKKISDEIISFLEEKYENHGYDYELAEDSIKVIPNELLDEYCDALLSHDLSDKKTSVISIINSLRSDKRWRDAYDPGDKVEADAFYISSSDKLLDCADNTPYYINHPVFSIEGYTHWYESEITDTFKRGIDLICQIYALEKQLKHYKLIRKNPDKALLEFQNNNDSWGSIMQFPYWIKMSRDLYNTGYANKDTFYLFMIKPGVKILDLEDIRYFATDHGKEFGTTLEQRFEFYDKLAKRENLDCDRMIVTIPASLDYKSLSKIIEFACKHGRNLNFICENPDVSVRVKTILVLNELEMHKIGNVFLKGNCFINVDPTYYNSYFVNTPNNKLLWHKYDYSSDYKYRRKEPTSLTIQIEECIKDNYRQNDGEINYDEIEEELLGTYHSKLKYNAYKVENSKDLALRQLKYWDEKRNGIS